ncbi:MAG TPA: isochorismate synthase [Candidatus Lustribacter sp.]|nr:isochorismate synthase [Candidatus Lustribacter sp.]
MSTRPDPVTLRGERDAAVPADPGVHPLVVRTVEITDPGPLLSLLPDLVPDLLPDLGPAGEAPGLAAWVRRGEGLVGWGQAASFTASGPDRFAAADAWWTALCSRAVVRDEVGLGGSGPVMFGSFPFAAGSAEPGRVVVPEVVIGHRGARWWVTTASLGAGVPSIGAVPGPIVAAPPRSPVGVTFADGALSPTEWEGAVGEAVVRITSGALDKVVLARDLQALATEALDPRWLLTRLAERYSTTWVFTVAGLLGATPEMLVRRDKGLVTSRVLAGTIRRTGDDAKDLALAGSLARSSKDLEEHEYAVRSVADALAPHCSSINVPESPFVLHLANVMHLATDVAGVAAGSASALELAAALHPSAAVCGTPTEVAAGLIHELEHMDRGRYSGPVGWMDASGDGEFGIALRCGQIDGRDPRAIRLYAGCGIVAGSDPEAELAESDVKLVPMRDALTSA